ncbi:MAG: 3-deoxy-7-phosphoheptulonate synthase AroG [Gammaproteobacteria bacterium]
MSIGHTTDDLRILGVKELESATVIHEKFPITDAAVKVIYDTRQSIHRILQGDDDRLLVIVGPCSIHDPEAALEYARRLKDVREQLSGELLVVMRVYFEKPRTTIGWKGLINDPSLNGSFQINKGLSVARELLLKLNDLGVPAATEYLDLITPQYISDLISWGAIGARTTESQVHRELASGLSCPVGFKNGTDGKLSIAMDAIRSASNPHHFLSVTKPGHTAIFSTSGNEDCHIILRGGKLPNYDPQSVQAALEQLKASNLSEKLMVDCSHGNSSKQFKRQLDVGSSVAEQMASGVAGIIGVMIESHLKEGRQDCIAGTELAYGQSITDACLSWDDTVPLLEQLASAVQLRRGKKIKASA